MYVTRSLYNQRKCIGLPMRQNLMLVQILQNRPIIFSVETFCRLYVALIPNSPTSICILTYIDSRPIFLSRKTLAHLPLNKAPWTFLMDISPDITPRTISPGHSLQRLSLPQHRYRMHYNGYLN